MRRIRIGAKFADLVFRPLMMKYFTWQPKIPSRRTREEYWQETCWFHTGIQLQISLKSWVETKTILSKKTTWKQCLDFAFLQKLRLPRKAPSLKKMNSSLLSNQRTRSPSPSYKFRTPSTRWSLAESVSIFNNCIRKVIWQNILTTWRELVQLNISFLKGKT